MISKWVINLILNLQMMLNKLDTVKLKLKYK